MIPLRIDPTYTGQPVICIECGKPHTEWRSDHGEDRYGVLFGVRPGDRQPKDSILLHPMLCVMCMCILANVLRTVAS